MDNGTEKISIFAKIKRLLIGKAHNPYDSHIFKNLSLVAFFAWVGLGADGLSSSAYGPQEAFMALGGHIYLSIFIAIASAITIIVISTSYSQIIELFPNGGGGYLVATKLLSPGFGMISGCALLIDYVLTITVSVASGSDAIFSFLPLAFQPFKLEFAVFVVVALIIINLRGAKESVTMLIPIFMVFVITHAFVIIYAIGSNIANFGPFIEATKMDVSAAKSEIGILGMLFVLLRAYSMGAGTYTGIEAVSNAMPILREPKVKTAKRAMQYMAYSLMFTVVGLMLAFLIFRVQPQEGKTLNAMLLESISGGWGPVGYIFLLVTLISEAALLFVAAQTGFLGGPGVLANMALDKWFPTRFTMLSDRFVNKNGILIMGISALLMMVFTKGSVTLLVVLYSINVFITFTLSQLGMVRHWWETRSHLKDWKKKITINGVGLVLTTFILISMVVIKFHEGGWVTLIVTGALITFAVFIKRHYYKTAKLLHRLNSLVNAINIGADKDGEPKIVPNPSSEFDPSAKTAVILVNGFNGLGLHTLFGVIRLFGGVFKNFIFVQIGIIDSGNFKGVEELEKLEMQVNNDIDRYVNFMRSEGYHCDGISVIGTDVINELDKITPKLLEKFPNVVFFKKLGSYFLRTLI